MTFLSHVQAELRRARLTRKGATHRPEDVPRFTHKSYPRMETTPLPEPEKLSVPISSVLADRSSAIDGNPGTKILLQEFGTLLGLGLKKRARGTRPYPSGGALYPVETYVISTSVEQLGSGVFHYNPTLHAFERLLNLPEDFDMKRLAANPKKLAVSSLIVFTSVWKRSSAKYGDLAYQHALLEAGHMSQNLLLVSTALGIGARPYAGFNDDLLIELLDIDSNNEQPVHTITLCAAPANNNASDDAHE